MKQILTERLFLSNQFKAISALEVRFTKEKRGARISGGGPRETEVHTMEYSQYIFFSKFSGEQNYQYFGKSGRLNFADEGRLSAHSRHERLYFRSYTQLVPTS